MAQILQGLALVGAAMIALWAYQWRVRDASVVDVGWAAAIGSLACLHAWRGEGDSGRRLLTAALAGVWSLRLASYLFLNRVLGKPEDRRYASLRAKWGQSAQRNFFLVFQFNALLAALLSVPFLALCADSRPLGARDLAAVLLWLAAVGGESLADRQLARFRADPASRGKTCQLGLWRYSRHPNYFFEWLHWWTYVLMAPLGPAGAPALVGPALMLILLYKVTGIPLLEAQALASRADYADYMRRTSPFLPWFPKTAGGS